MFPNAKNWNNATYHQRYIIYVFSIHTAGAPKAMQTLDNPVHFKTKFYLKSLSFRFCLFKFFMVLYPHIWWSCLFVDIYILHICRLFKWLGGLSARVAPISWLHCLTSACCLFFVFFACCLFFVYFCLLLVCLFCLFLCLLFVQVVCLAAEGATHIVVALSHVR